MISVKASVTINRPPQAVWEYASCIDRWWLESNPKEHIELSVVGGGEIRQGTEFVLKEIIAGVRGEALASVTEFKPPWKLVWASREARYRFLGFSLEVVEGGTFDILETDGGSLLSHHVWGELRAGVFSGLLEWFFKNILRGEQKDYRHTHRELLFIKTALESQAA